MCDWAEHSFKLDKPSSSGATERVHLEQVEKQTGKSIPALEAPVEFPKSVSYIWSAFVELSNTRTAGMSSLNPISYLEIQAWRELTNSSITAWEVEAIKRLDGIYLGVMNG